MALCAVGGWAYVILRMEFPSTPPKRKDEGDVWVPDPVVPSVEKQNGGGVESPRPDIVATRQWVEEKLNAATVNCVRVEGETHNDLLYRLRKAGWIQDAEMGKRLDASGVVPFMGFGYGGEGGDYEFFRNGEKHYKVRSRNAMGSIPSDERTPIQIEKAEYDKAWEEFDWFWQSNGSYGIMYSVFCPKPDGYIPEFGTDWPKWIEDEWRESGWLTWGQYPLSSGKTLGIEYLCGGVYGLRSGNGLGVHYIHQPTLLAQLEADKKAVLL